MNRTDSGTRIKLYALRRAQMALERQTRGRIGDLQRINDALRAELARQSADLGERTQAEEALRERENLLRTIIDTTPECVKLVGPDGALKMMNPAGLRMIEADSLSQVYGKSVYPLIAPEHREAF